ncbi:GT4 family glycosyltransferase PelF [Schaedlerella arabinosiphila]|uniref:GT4 family glycosyltransferase PelF n=1 Tax=Schaedlerella arabinosiphila TaxID=2044587 RepID=UPI002558127E|nr:GT4 family glycosyltransferase PelF [Schaedlerella arabinosiphila]
MKVCIVVEGCYPYVTGGVSSWVHGLIQSFPKLEFIILAIISNRSLSGKFTYELPENVSEVHELYLEDTDWNRKGRRRCRLSKAEYQAFRSLVRNRRVEWETVFRMFQEKPISLDKFLMGEDFLKIVRESYDMHYSQLVFSDYLWTIRSVYLPLLFALKMKLPKADLYHCVATGYAGVLGSMAKVLYGSRLLISEHGIYTREREEELLRADWVQGVYKNIWIDQFKKMSKLAYDKADLVTSLYEYARELQIDLGCPVEKTMVTPNGVSVERLKDLPGKTKEDEGRINVGAVLRVTPIKDVKTMIQAFSFAKEREPRLKLWIMGPTDEDEGYARECREQVEALGIEDVVFTGRIDIREYLGRMDMTILTSLSEGQPLTILEGYAAHKPAIATDVGNCRGLIYGENDGFGDAGIVAHIMNVEEIAQAMVDLARNEPMRLQMGENGYQRVVSGYQIEHMRQKYQKIYKDFSDSMGFRWEE